MVLYSLKNFSYVLDVYQDKVVFKGRWWKSAMFKEWKEDLTLQFTQLEKVDLVKRPWPLPHQLKLTHQKRHMVFRFHGLYPFFERLKLYLQRQQIKFQGAEAQLPPPSKTVLQLVEEKKKFKRAS